MTRRCWRQCGQDKRDPARRTAALRRRLGQCRPRPRRPPPRRAAPGSPALPNDAADFPQRWRAVLTPADQWARFQTLAWNDPAAAARQVKLLDPPHRAAAEARLALQRDDPAAAALLAAVPQDLANAQPTTPDDLHARPGALAAARRAHARTPSRCGGPRGAAAQLAASSAALAGLLGRARASGPPTAAGRRCRRRLRAGRRPRPDRAAPDAGCGFPRRLHRAAHAAPAGRGDARTSRRSPPLPPRRSPRAARGTGWAAPPPPRARTRAPPTPRPPPGRPPSTASSPPWRWATTPPPSPRASMPCATRKARATQAFGLTQREVVRAAALLVAWGEPRRAAGLPAAHGRAGARSGRPRADRAARAVARPAADRGGDRPAHGPRRLDAAAGRLADRRSIRRRTRSIPPSSSG